MLPRAALLALVLGPWLVGCQPLAVEDAEIEPIPVAVAETDAYPADPGAGGAGAPTVLAEATHEGSAEMPHGAVSATETKTDTVEADLTRGLAAEAAYPRPADPLTSAEITQATDLALGAPETEALVATAVDRDEVATESVADVRALAGRPSYRVLYTERAPDKWSAGRAAEVAIYRYDTNQQVLNSVDLASGEVAALDLPEGFVMPLVADEIAEATTVARGDPRVREALTAAGLDVAGARANALLTRGLEPGSPCAVNRCLKLFFGTFEQPVPTFHVIVNLSDLSVVEVVPFDMSPGGGMGVDRP